MGKGSGRRPQNITDEELEKAWNSIFAGHPNEGQFDREDDYGNELPSNMADKEKPPKPHNHKDPDRFVDDIGDA
jgi:hypothetical protein